MQLVSATFADPSVAQTGDLYGKVWQRRQGGPEAAGFACVCWFRAWELERAAPGGELAVRGAGLQCWTTRWVKIDSAVCTFPCPSASGKCVHTFSDAHSDYVMRVAAAPAAGLVASAGLRSEVVLYDLHAMKAVPLRPVSSTDGSTGAGAAAAAAAGSSGSASMRENGGVGGAAAGGMGGGVAGYGGVAGLGPLQQQQQQHPPQQQQGQGQQGPKGSIYALAMNPTGTLLATGTTESFIRVYDPRTHAKAMKLKVRREDGSQVAGPCRSKAAACGAGLRQQRV